MAQHAKLSPSSAERWMTCPSSVVLSEGIKEKSSEYADEGTAAHFLAATCLNSDTNAADHIDKTIHLFYHDLSDSFGEAFNLPADDMGTIELDILNEFIVDEDMARYVQVYVDYVRSVRDATNGELFVEVSVPLCHMTGEEGATGTSDAIILTEDEVIVIDLKYGRGVEVSAEENRQMMMYASGAVEMFRSAITPKRARMVIVQPRLSFSPSEWDCEVQKLFEFNADAKFCADNIELIEEGNLDIKEFLMPSEKGCKFCKAKARCPALRDFVAGHAGDFEDLLTAPPPDAGKYTNDELALHMSAIDLIEDWCKAIRAEVEKELFAGGIVPGYKLVQGRKGSRAWSSKEAAEELLKKLKLKRDEMYELKLISPTVAEKILKNDEKKWSRVQELITQADGSPSVAPVTDKRPAISVAPSPDDFA